MGHGRPSPAFHQRQILFDQIQNGGSAPVVPKEQACQFKYKMKWGGPPVVPKNRPASSLVRPPCIWPKVNYFLSNTKGAGPVVPKERAVDGHEFYSIKEEHIQRGRLLAGLFFWDHGGPPPCSPSKANPFMIKYEMGVCGPKKNGHASRLIHLPSCIPPKAIFY